jgi:type IV pilus assembly protein PilV
MLKRRAPGRAAPRSASRGFSLIEVLVSMFIVSMGILALAGLLQSASRYGKMSELRSSATLLANDIADHIRANPGGAAGNFYNVTDAFPATGAHDNRSPAGNLCEGSGTKCSPQDLAYVDVAIWSAQVFATLPKGTPFIQYNAAGGGGAQNGSVDVWVAWQDPNTTGGTTERPVGECPASLDVGADSSVRCVYLQVGL